MRTPPHGNSQINQGFGVGSTIRYYDSNSWGVEKERLPSPEEFDPKKEYTSWELDRFADAILWEQIQAGKKNFDDPVILMYEHLHERRKREIYTAVGIPDATLMSELAPDGHNMYWRTHPQGRKVQEKRDNKNSFYR